ncbi:MerR family transcriptional regulator [Pseudomonas eucalypticola]|uniref:MerR family transcriptional regulator n=1 Tax=Pseudomonas eucalypticola TaxID=2599595 RepID=A0A7D5H4Y5_9PSED|nr:MerR family transcriptional regulator [Pseudomonas eucalypticola]QKZ03943.1 MerR family transcriptional regulator [Pseudomonas eucalypticola]
MLISELARQSGISPRMLRYYEDQGLLRPVRRASGYREYRRVDQVRLTHIVTLQATGMTLEVIRRILPPLVAEVPLPQADSPLVAALREQRRQVVNAIHEQRRALRIIDQYLSDLGQVDVLPVANQNLEAETPRLQQG